MSDSETIFSFLKFQIYLSLAWYTIFLLTKKLSTDEKLHLLLSSIWKLTLFIGLIPYLPWIDTLYIQRNIDLELSLVVKSATLNCIFLSYFMLRHGDRTDHWLLRYPLLILILLPICIGLTTFVPKVGLFKYLSTLSKTDDNIKMNTHLPFYILSTANIQNYNLFEYVFYQRVLQKHQDEVIFIESKTNEEETNVNDHHGPKIAKGAIHHAILAAHQQLGTPLKFNISVKVDYIFDSNAFRGDQTLAFGDQLLEINSIKIKSKSQLEPYLCDYKKPNIQLRIMRLNKLLEINHPLSKKYNCEFKLGFELVEEFDYILPKNIEIVEDDSSGDSSGLALALHVYYAMSDVITDNNLKVSITGAIDENGKVGNVGGLHYKTMLALKEKSDYLVLPKTMYKTYSKIKSTINNNKYSHPTKVLFVSSLKDAIEQLNPLILQKKK